jgi:hypothetical protein
MAGRTSRVGGVFFIPIGNGPTQLEHAGIRLSVWGLRDSVFHAGNGSCIYAAQKATLGVMTLAPYYGFVTPLLHIDTGNAAKGTRYWGCQNSKG